MWVRKEEVLQTAGGVREHRQARQNLLLTPSMSNDDFSKLENLLTAKEKIRDQREGLPVHRASDLTENLDLGAGTHVGFTTWNSSSKGIWCPLPASAGTAFIYTYPHAHTTHTHVHTHTPHTQLKSKINI